MRFGFFAFLVLGCGATVKEVPADADVDSSVSETAPPDSSTPAPDSFVPPFDAPLPPMGCEETDPTNPPIFCGPAAGGAVPCSTTVRVDGCPTDTACMARVKQIGSVLEHRVGRFRLWAPDALLSLSSIAFDPNVNAKCVNAGSESMNWLFRIDLGAGKLESGGARGSLDGAKFSFLSESFTGAGVSAICPGFVGPTDAWDLRPVSVPLAKSGSGFDASIARLNIPLYDSTGVPIVLPLRELAVRVPSITDPSCIGSWEKKYWCDGDSLGWTTGGSIVAKITAEDADRVPIKSAGCQSLCAILVNDATKTDGKVCRRGPDGKIPEIGTHCAGGASCKNAFLMSITFASYGVDITP